MSDDSEKHVATAELTPESTNLFPRKFGPTPEFIRGDGPYLYDRDGTEYFDGIGGNQCSNIGHGVESVATAAAEQMKQLEYTSSMLFVSDRSQEFATKMATFLPDGFEHVWMVSGGSEANESAIKLAREYHRETGSPEKHVVIGRRLSFHGNTLGTLAASGIVSRREPYASPYMDWPKAPAAYPYRCRFCADEGECREHGVECAKELETVIRDIGSKHVAAFIAEPVGGAANAAVVPGEEYFRTVREICDRHDVLMIVDEVMSGMGRTGENFAIEHWDVTPDIITCAKGMSAGYTPLAGTMPRSDIVEVFAEKEDGFTHGHTYSFNPTSCAIGTAVLEYMEEHDVVGNAREIGSYARDRFEEFYEYDFVGDVRGKGLMLGVEFVADRETKAPLENGGPEFRENLLQTALEERITVYPGGGSVDGERGDHVLITPPLTITQEQADEMIDRLHATFERLDIE